MKFNFKANVWNTNNFSTITHIMMYILILNITPKACYIEAV